MKAFEEWWEKEYPYHDPRYYTYHRSRKAWRAALEWALDQRDTGLDEDGSEDYRDWNVFKTQLDKFLKGAIERIEEELEEK